MSRTHLRPLHVALLIPWIVAVVAARMPIRDNSFLWHVRAGSTQLEAGSVLTHDPFSFTFFGAPWRTQSWLVELGYGWLDGRFGLSFVPWFIGACAVLLLVTVMITAADVGASLSGVAVIGVAASWLGAAFFNPRPVIVSYVCLALVILAARHQRLRWALPVIAWAWAASHGSFVLGIGYVFLDGVVRRRRGAVTDSAVMGVAALLTAHGLGVLEFLRGFVASSDALDYLTEWATPNFLSLALALVIPTIAVLLFGAVKGHLGAGHLLIIVPALVLMASASRSVFPGWLYLVPALAASLGVVGSRTASATSPRAGARAIEIATLVGLAGVVLALPFAISDAPGLAEDRFPTRASTAIDGERVYSDDVAAGYLIYRFGSDRPVFVDDRAELYGAEFFAAAVATRSGMPIWRDVFEDWGFDQALTRPDDGLTRALLEAGWLTRYRDPRFVVLQPPQNELTG